jgi:single-strand DNA-binding protein
MSSINKVTLMGRLGADPEVRRMNNGDPIVNLRIATSEVWRDKNTGEKKERTEWHTVVIFAKRICDIAEKYLKKGHLIHVEGMLCTRQWEDSAGQKRYSTEVVLKEFRGEMTLLPQGGGNGRTQAGSPDEYGSGDTRSDNGSQSGGTLSGGPGRRADDPGLDDEIPF